MKFAAPMPEQSGTMLVTPGEGKYFTNNLKCYGPISFWHKCNKFNFLGPQINYWLCYIENEGSMKINHIHCRTAVTA